jgi:hypothetical protein
MMATAVATATRWRQLKQDALAGQQTCDREEKHLTVTCFRAETVVMQTCDHDGDTQKSLAVTAQTATQSTCDKHRNS